MIEIFIKPLRSLFKKNRTKILIVRRIFYRLSFFIPHKFFHITKQTMYKFILLFGLVFVLSCNSVVIPELKYDKIIELSFPKEDLGPTGHREKTLGSIQKIDNIYLLRYYGDYLAMRKTVTDNILKYKSKDTINCSIFSVGGSNLLMGRNFDNPDCGILIGLYKPENKYKSIAFSRTSDFTFSKETEIEKLDMDARNNLLFAPYFTPDGINECGLTVALASVTKTNIQVDTNKESIFITCLVREILDNAANIEEGIKVAQSYNIFDESPGIISHHIMIADSSGNSVILEYRDNKMQIIESKDKMQILTNIPAYNSSPSQQSIYCPRYRALYDYLANSRENIDKYQAMFLLKKASLNATQWSAIYDIGNREILISTYGNYDRLYKVSFE